MKASELKIGYWYKRDTQPEGFKAGKTCYILNNRNPKMYKPIPLTEEWLFKFGFTKTMDYAYNSYKKGEFEIRGGDVFYYRHVELKSVHQLQNLYFALTGTELEVKP